MRARGRTAANGTRRRRCAAGRAPRARCRPVPRALPRPRAPWSPSTQKIPPPPCRHRAFPHGWSRVSRQAGPRACREGGRADGSRGVARTRRSAGTTRNPPHQGAAARPRRQSARPRRLDLGLERTAVARRAGSGGRPAGAELALRGPGTRSRHRTASSPTRLDRHPRSGPDARAAPSGRGAPPLGCRVSSRPFRLSKLVKKEKPSGPKDLRRTIRTEGRPARSTRRPPSTPGIGITAAAASIPATELHQRIGVDVRFVERLAHGLHVPRPYGRRAGSAGRIPGGASERRC